MKTRVWDKKPLSSAINTMYTALTQQHKVGPKKLNQLLISQQWDLRSLGPEHTHTHTRTQGWTGRTQLQGRWGNERDGIKLLLGEKSGMSNVPGETLFAQCLWAGSCTQPLPACPLCSVLMLFALDAAVSGRVSALCMKECGS